MTLKTIVLLLSICLAFALCTTPKRTERGFYYWRSTFEWAQTDSTFFQDLRINKLYVKYFDVKWEEAMGQIVPVARIEFKNALPKMPIVPVVFITNESLQQLSDNLVNDLGQKIISKIEGMNLKNDSLQVSEIQIDCDWTDSTKDKYFRLLTYLKQHLGKHTLLSATIRLHQIKYYKKRGVPAIDKGLLMCYNMDSPKKTNIKNSIFDLALAKDYLQNLGEYPLKLDVALPLFAWGVVFRQGNFKGLINQLTDKDLLGNTAFEQVDANLFRAVTDTYLKNTEIYADDLIRTEESDMVEMEKLSKYIADKLQNKTPTIILFHYDQMILQGYEKTQIEQVFEAF